MSLTFKSFPTPLLNWPTASTVNRSSVIVNNSKFLTKIRAEKDLSQLADVSDIAVAIFKAL